MADDVNPTDTADELDTAPDVDDPDGAPDADGDDEFVPPTQAEWEGLRSTLRKVRKELREARRGGGKPDAEVDTDAVVAKAREDADGVWKPRVVKMAARSAFVEAGLVLPKGREDQTMSRALKLLNMDEVDVTEDGDVDGLSEQIAEVRADFPELFARRAPRNVDASDRGAAGGKPKSSAQLLVDAAFGRR